jgi:membrane protein
MRTSNRLDLQRVITGALLLGVVALAWLVEKPAARQDAALAPMPVPAPPRAIARSAAGDLPCLHAFRMPVGWWKRVLLDAYHAMNRHRLVAVAAGVVFYALLAIFPAITAFVSLYSLFADPATVGEHLSLLANVLPAGALDIVREQVVRITARPAELGFAFVGGTVLALWSANAGVKAMMDALNVIEERDEQRGFIRLNAISLTITLGAIVFLLLAVGAVVAFPLVMSAFGLNEITSTATWLIRWPVLLALSLGALHVLYRFGPSQTNARRQWFTPGSLFAAVAWIAGSAALSLYLSKFADYNATYGSLGAAIGLMMWMWLSSVVVLAGAQFDSIIRKSLPCE